MIVCKRKSTCSCSAGQRLNLIEDRCTILDWVGGYVARAETAPGSRDRRGTEGADMRHRFTAARTVMPTAGFKCVESSEELLYGDLRKKSKE